MFKFVGACSTLVTVIALNSPAAGQLAYECQDEIVPSCSGFSAERSAPDRINVEGKVIKIGEGAYRKARVSVEVHRASVENAPSQLDIDVGQCLKSPARIGDEVNVYVWRRPSPNSGAYTLAPCAK
jgi:hypothetical protein